MTNKIWCFGLRPPFGLIWPKASDLIISVVPGIYLSLSLSNFLQTKISHCPCSIPVQNVEILWSVKAFVELENCFILRWTSFPVISSRVSWYLRLDLLNVLKSLGKLPNFSSFPWDQGEVGAFIWKAHLVNICIVLPYTKVKGNAVSKWKVIVFFSEIEMATCSSTNKMQISQSEFHIYSDIFYFWNSYPLCIIQWIIVWKSLLIYNYLEKFQLQYNMQLFPYLFD